jgi:hypothetical protein
MRKLSILIFVLFLCLSAANAVTIVRVEGVVTYLDGVGGYSFDDSIRLGTTFIETYYFSDLTDSSSDPELGKYAADYSMLSIGNYVFTSSEVGMSVKCYDYFPTSHSGNTKHIEGGGIVYIDSLPYEYNSIDWLYHDSYFGLKSNSYTPASDEFPSFFPDLSVFDQRNSWSLVSNVETNNVIPDGIYVSGELTSVEVIPEPCSLVLLGLGSIALLRRRR